MKKLLTFLATALMLSTYFSSPQTIFAVEKSTNSFQSIIEKQFFSVGGNPCDNRISILLGQTFGGALNSNDCQLSNGTYVDYYSFEGQKNQQVTIILESSTFDTFLKITNQSGTFSVENGGNGMISQIQTTLPETGLYTIFANSTFPDVIGGYRLKLSGSQPCTYTVSPTTAELPGLGGTYDFNVETQPECHWQAIAIAQTTFATTNSFGIGPGVASYTVAPNTSGEIRTGFISLTTSPFRTAGQLFSFTQQINQCNFSITPTTVILPANVSTGTLSLTVEDGCKWSVSSNTGFVEISGSSNGNGTISYSAAQNTGAIRELTVNFYDQDIIFRQVGINTKNNDFDGDGKTDISIFRSGPNPAQWWLLRSSDGGNNAYSFGLGTDKPVPADYTGDGKTDIAFFRASTSEWFILRSEDSTFYGFPFGASGDIPAPGDFDGDGVADQAVYRPTSSTWFINRSSDGGTTIETFGIAEDKPVVADYDGDGKDDIAIYRPSVSQWWLNRSSAGVKVYQFGQPGDKTVQGDHTGDGKADVAFWRPNTGEWFIIRSDDDSFYSFPFGTSGDIPTPGDYDGDGTFDAAVFRPSTTTWFINGSTSGTQIFGFGLSDDIPLANSYSIE